MVFQEDTELSSSDEHIKNTATHGAILTENNVDQQKGSSTTKAGFSGGSAVKNSPAKARDRGLIPESGRSPGERYTTHFLAWKISWTKEPSGLQSIGSDIPEHAHTTKAVKTGKKEK